jgi:superfamily II DNA or RNA helicase
MLRERTQALVLLTGTPHQGDTGKFRSLLKLVRPDLTEQLDELEIYPEIVADVVLRNRKVDVTDADGNFIFRGHTVSRLPIEPTRQMRELDRRLRIYLQRGYNAESDVGGYAGRAIGFVMTTYRKLASSSVAALTRALERRLERLLAGEQAEERQNLMDELDFSDSVDDVAELDLGEPRTEFFAAETDMLRELLGHCESAAEHDAKIETFRAVYEDLVVRQGKKILVFTEYRATQERLALEVERLSGRVPAIINGSQKLDEKIAAMEAFDGDCEILISTEAGGEGLNLHRRCHVVLNFDLPWNPARIVQRIGRVYRYGQKEHVAVLNFHASDTIDSEIISLALTRVETLSRQMAPLGSEFGERYFSEILGELLEQLDLSAALAEALSGSVERSQDRVDEAIERARNARDLQSEILSAASGFDPEALIRLGRFRTHDVMRFIVRMAPFLAIEATVRDEARERLDLRLPEDLRGNFAEFGGRTVIEATTSRSTASASRGFCLLDFRSEFLRELVRVATSPDFGGSYATAKVAQAADGHVAAFITRWQSERGDPIGEELSISHRGKNGHVTLDNGVVSQLLRYPVKTVPPESEVPEERQRVLEAMQDRVEVHAAERANRFKHLNDLILVAAADIHST